MRVDVARRWWPLAAGVVLGVVVGLLVSLLGTATRRAEASVLISSPSGVAAVEPMLPNLRQLAVSGVLAGNVRSTLRLPESTAELRRHLHADVRAGSQVIVIAATEGQADHARQVAQEAAVVFSQLVDAHFGTAKPELHAALLDSAHVLASSDRHVLRNSLAGALVGLLLGAAATFVLASRSELLPDGVVDDADFKKRERVLEKRVQAVTARERALAGQAGKLASRERELDEREAAQARAERELQARAVEVAATKRELAERAGEVAAGERELQQRAAAVPAPAEPEHLPEPVVEAPEPVPAARAARSGGWNFEDLQRTVDAQTDVSPDQAEEWRTYLFFLREHAAADGSLPSQFDGLVEDVFGALVVRTPR